MRPVTLSPLLALLSGCVFGLGPLPPEVDDLSDYLRRQNLRLVPAEVAYDRAFERIDPDAHVVTYEVTVAGPTSSPHRRGAYIDVFWFASEDATEAGVAGLRRVHGAGSIYVDGRLVVYLRGETPGLQFALERRFGTPRAA